MRVNPNMTEYEFIEEIDDNFIFDENREYEEAARAGAAISDNAALMVNPFLPVRFAVRVVGAPPRFSVA